MDTHEQTHELTPIGRGQRVFLLGNGPSLAKVDLNRLKNEVVFACGRIQTYSGFDEREWAIHDYFMVDKARNPSWAEDVQYHVNAPEHYPVWLRWDIAVSSMNGIQPWYDYDHLHVVPRCGHGDAANDRASSWHLPHFCTFGGSAAAMLQVAFLREYEPVILLGFDLGYQVRSADNHFSKDYQPVNTWATKAAVDIHNETLQTAHENAYAAYKQAGREIVNATPGGMLEVYPRAGLEELLS